MNKRDGHKTQSITDFKREIHIQAKKFSLVTGFNAFADNQSHQSELLFQAKYKSHQIVRL